MSNRQKCVLSPPNSHLSPAFSQHINTLLCIGPPQTSPSYCCQHRIFLRDFIRALPPACCYVVEIYPGVFVTQRSSYSKTAPSTQILTFSTLSTSSSSPCPGTTPNPSTTTPQLPRISLVTGGYQFIRDRTNRKRHETHDSCSSIRLLASEIFTRTAVSLPTGMRPLRRHSTTTSGGRYSCCGVLSRVVAMEVSQFVLYFLFLFEQFHHHPELPIGMRLVHALHILLDRISTGIFRMEHSALRGTSSPLPHRVPIRRGLYR